MTSYPGAIPTLAVITGTTVPSAADNNTPNAEIVAMATEFGLNPQNIDDTVAPASTPSDVSNYLDMTANIVKSMVNMSSWNKSAIVNKQTICGNGNGNTVGIAGTSFLPAFGLGLLTTENQATSIMTNNGIYSADSFIVELLSTQPADGYLEFRYYNEGAYVNNSWYYQIPQSSPAGIYRFPASWRPFNNFSVDQKITIAIVNNSPTAVSAQIGAWSVVLTQMG